MLDNFSLISSQSATVVCIGINLLRFRLWHGVAKVWKLMNTDHGHLVHELAHTLVQYQDV